MKKKGSERKGEFSKNSKTTNNYTNEKTSFIETDEEEEDDYSENKQKILIKIREIAESFSLVKNTAYNSSKKLDFNWALDMLRDIQYKYEEISKNYTTLKNKHKKHYEKTQKDLNALKRLEKAEEMKKMENEMAKLKEIQKKRQEEKNKLRKGRVPKAKVFFKNNDLEDDEDNGEDEEDEDEKYFT